MTEHLFTVGPEGANQRLDLYLVEHFPNRSRSQIQKQIQRGSVQINGKVAVVHQFLKDGDQVEIIKETEKSKKGKAESILPSPYEGEGQGEVAAPTIIKETADWLVIDKPAGLLVHPDAQHEHGTLVDFLIEHDPAIAKVGEDPERPGIVHRLDREVSGLMVIAKTQEAYEALKKQFGQHTVEKKYLALVHGEMSKDIGDIKFRIARSTSKARMAARPENEEEGKAAWTHYHVIRRFTRATLVELEILSGRTHQIRAHMHALGHSVIGDPLYTLTRKNRGFDTKRIMLQSISLAFDDPKTGMRQTFTLEPDAEFGRLET